MTGRALVDLVLVLAVAAAPVAAGVVALRAPHGDPFAPRPLPPPAFVVFPPETVPPSTGPRSNASTGGAPSTLARLTAAAADLDQVSP